MEEQEGDRKIIPNLIRYIEETLSAENPDNKQHGICVRGFREILVPRDMVPARARIYAASEPKTNYQSILMNIFELFFLPMI